MIGPRLTLSVDAATGAGGDARSLGVGDDPSAASPASIERTHTRTNDDGRICGPDQRDRSSRFEDAATHARRNDSARTARARAALRVTTPHRALGRVIGWRLAPT